MKSKIILGIIAVVILIVAGTVFFFWQRGPHLPRAQTPQPPGTFISKNQLVFAGYKTPEAALESMFWAFMHGDYDVAVASFPLNQQAKMKKELGNPGRFKSGAKSGEFSELKGVEIMARKNVNPDKVELKFEMIDSGNNGKAEIVIFPVIKAGKEWKLNMEGGHDYETNWDNSGDVANFSK